MEAVTSEAARFSIQTTTTCEIADAGVPVGVAAGVGGGASDGRAEGRAEGAGVGRAEGRAEGGADEGRAEGGADDGRAAGVREGPADGADDTWVVGPEDGAADDDVGPEDGADDGAVDGASNRPVVGEPALDALAAGARVAGAVALASGETLPPGRGVPGGVAWHAARRTASPRAAKPRPSLIAGIAREPRRRSGPSYRRSCDSSLMITRVVCFE